MSEAKARYLSDFLFVSQADSPVVISVGHDSPLPGKAFDGIYEPRPKGGRDKFTWFIARDAARISAASLVWGLVPRRYIDYNRCRVEPQSACVGDPSADNLSAYEDEQLRHAYEEYHKSIRALTSRAVETFGRCLLLDIHGFKPKSTPGQDGSWALRQDIILGTHHRSTVSGDVDRAFAETMRSAGYRVRAPGEQHIAGERFCGRHTIQHHSNASVDAMQVEVNGRYRERGAERIGKALSETIREFLLEYQSRL